MEPWEKVDSFIYALQYLGSDTSQILAIIDIETKEFKMFPDKTICLYRQSVIM